MKKYIMWAVVIIVLGMILVNYSKRTDVNLAGKTVNLGAVLAMSGYAAADGEDIKRGVELARADLAERGTTLNVEYYDDATDPTKTISGLTLLASKGIKYIVGPTWGFQVSAALPFVENKDVALLLPVQASDNVLGTSSKAFFAKASTLKKEGLTEDWLKKVNAKNVAIFVTVFAGDNWTEGHIGMWTNAVQNSGAKLVMTEKPNLMQESDDVKTLLLKAKKNGVDTILWSGTDGGSITLIKTMQEMGFNAHVLGTTQIEKVVSTGKIAAGDLALYSIVGNTSSEFAKKFASVYGADTRFDYAEQAYDLTMIAAQDAARGETNVASSLKNNTNYKGYGGTYTFDANGDVPKASWKIVEVK